MDLSCFCFPLRPCIYNGMTGLGEKVVEGAGEWWVWGLISEGMQAE